MAAYAFGIDIGGTNIECGLVGEDAALICKSSVRTEPHRGNEHVMELIAAQIREILNQTGISADAVRGVGIGMPGLVDPDRGISILASNLNFRDYPVAGKIASLTGLPVFIENDVRLYIFGEAVHGAGQAYANVLGLTVGTGIAAALINNREIYRGGGFAGEIGHIPIDGIPYRCACGLHGCLETIVSATGLARQAKAAVAEGKQTLLSDFHPDPDMLTAKDISDAYDRHDPVAIAIMEHTGKLLGRTLSYLVPMLSPDAIIIGGGASKAGDRLVVPVKQELFAHLHPIYRDNLVVVRALRNEEAGVIGSALYAFRMLQPTG